MVAPEDHIRPVGEDNRRAVEVVPVAIGEEHLEEAPIRLVAVADHRVEDPILRAVVVDHLAEDPILLVAAEGLLEEGPSYRAVEGVEDPNCPVAEGTAGRNHPGFVADSHLRKEVAEGGHRMTCPWFVKSFGKRVYRTVGLTKVRIDDDF